MKCPYCQKEMHQISDNDNWPDCKHHGDVIVWCCVLNTEMQWLLNTEDYRMWLCWDTEGFHLSNNDERPPLLLKLDYYPQIVPEEAREFVERMMKMMVFS